MLYQICANVDVDKNLIVDVAADMVKPAVLAHVDIVAGFTGTDIFVLGPSPSEIETIGTTFNGRPEISLDQRLRVAIYGDIESVEHAKTRVLIMIDQIVRCVSRGPAEGIPCPPSCRGLVSRRHSSADPLSPSRRS